MKSKFIKLFLLIGLSIPLLATANSDPWYEQNPSCVIDRGNPARTGEYNEKPILTQPKLLWQTKVLGKAPLVCYKNLVIFNGPTVINIDTSKYARISTIQDMYEGGAVIYKDYLYSNSTYSTAKLIRLEPQTGKQFPVVVINNREDASFTPLLYQDKAILSMNYSVAAYAKDDGKQLWQFVLDKEARNDKGWAGSLSTDGERVYFSNHIDTIYAIDINTGKLVWNYQGVRADANYITIAKDKAYVSGTDGIYCLAAKTGKLLWHNPLYDTNFPKSLAVSQDRVFAVESREALHALDAITGKVFWHYTCPKDLYISSLPTVVENTLYLQCATELVALATTTGKPIWQQTIPEGYEGNGQNSFGAMPYQGKLFVQGVENNLAAFG